MDKFIIKYIPQLMFAVGLLGVIKTIEWGGVFIIVLLLGYDLIKRFEGDE